ncbi:hypothetical protein LEP1GSC079_1594 [Leptospira interrogans str. FPW1039]|uniref:Uncharacterized protein n=1 Tax=Leptospira interrogans str. FPW1039 TaxID=1193040 RepID=A0A0F6ICX6_LEPIR|nr:hypothetical protein LEP1GSC079_1594 [Leptospira interrogans str. FPW1039]
MDCWSSNLPYNGPTLKDNIKQMEKIVGFRPKEVFVDLGYKWKDSHPKDVQVHLSNKNKKNIAVGKGCG